MAGMIIVRGAIDQVPEVAAAAEKIMVLQSIELGDDFTLQDPIPYPSKSEAFFPRTKVLYTVNGVLGPTITMRPGEVQRWRMVNAAEGKFMSLALRDRSQKAVDMNVLAWDGLTLPAPDAVPVVLLSSGNRVEMLVKVDQPGTYDLVLTPGSSQKPSIPGMPDEQYPPTNSNNDGNENTTTTTTPAANATAAAALATTSRSSGAMPSSSDPMPGMVTMGNLADIPGELEVRPIATVIVEGPPVTMAMPLTLPAWDPPMPPVSRTRTLSFTVQRDGLEFLSFGVDGFKYSPYREPYQATLGTAEEWTLVNAHDPKLMQHAHVFHIHVNPFKITKINGHVLASPWWRDTFVLTKTDLDSFTFETHFADFSGKFVEHCHVLAHEDLGMMEAIEVVTAPPRSQPPATPSTE
jgi:FtsP/CotA-like multicopper oxidase with cupredoxin domain